MTIALNDHAHHDHAHHDHAHSTQVHGHRHGESHAHAVPTNRSAFAIGIALNLGFVVIEAGYGFVANSVALIADAGHNLSDVLGLVVSWGALALARRRPSARYTYGLRGSTILAALFNAIVLLVAVGAIALEAIQRLTVPVAVTETTVIFVALIGIVINTATALMFMAGRKHDLNMRSAFIHMAGDAAVSAGVVIAGILMLYTGWLWLDPAMSLAIALLIVLTTWGLLRDAINMSLQAVPAGIDTERVRTFLNELPHVEAIHDLHIWPMSTTETALTAHLVMPNEPLDDDALVALTEQLQQRFGIGHCTVQVERGTQLCQLAPVESV